MIEIASIVMICCLIHSLDLISVLFFGLGIGILGAIDEVFYKKVYASKGWPLLVFETLGMILISLSLLNEVPLYMVFVLAFGLCFYLIAYNMKKNKKAAMMFLLILPICCIVLPFFFALDLIRFIVFAGLSVFVFESMYFRKPMANTEDKLN